MLGFAEQRVTATCLCTLIRFIHNAVHYRYHGEFTKSGQRAPMRKHWGPFEYAGHIHTPRFFLEDVRKCFILCRPWKVKPGLARVKLSDKGPVNFSRQGLRTFTFFGH